MAGILDEICERKRVHVAAAKIRRPLARLEEEARAAQMPRGFIGALGDARRQNRFGLICEIKKASPSKGRIADDFDPAGIARAYEAGGAACLSVLTDAPYFEGSDDDLGAARAATALPVLRKDFMLDPYQIVESRAIGADCVLLILAALGQTQAAELEALAHYLGLDVLIEVHDEAELERALEMKSPLIGINNRNLGTLEVTLQTSHRLAALAPKDRILVAESGIRGRDDLLGLEKSGFQCFLIGQMLMRAEDRTEAVRKLGKEYVGGQTQPSG